MKTVTLSARGRYILVTFPEDDEIPRRLRQSGRLHWKPGLGGWVTEVKDVGGLVATLRALGLAVRFGAPVSRTPPQRVSSVFDRPLPREAAEGRNVGISTRALQDVYFHPSDVNTRAFRESYAARWRGPPAALPSLEPVDVEKLDTEFDVPGFRGELYPFQRQGVAFLKALGWSGIVADEMGLGKTVEAIAAALLAGERALVVCPASVKYNWRAEVHRFTDRTARVLNGNRWDGPPDAFFSIVNYDLLPRSWERLNEEAYGLLVLDEAHYAKNPRARRSQACYGLDVPRRILLTGTPLLNRPQDLYPLLDLAQPGKWGTREAFEHVYCRRVTRLADGGLRVGGVAAEHLADLKERLRGVMIRRQKAAVLRDLPPKTIEVQPVDLSENARPAYRALESDLTDYLRAEGLDGALRGPNWLKTLAKMHSLKQFTIAERHAAALEWLRRKAAEGEKVVVFSQYLQPLHDLHRAFRESSVLIDGSVASAERLRRVERFQENPRLRYCIGQIQAAGTGLNLTAARHVLFLDLAWTPAAHAQAMDRCHRIGQTRPVVVTFLVTPGTIDEYLQDFLLTKQAVINTVMGEKQRVVGERQALRAVAEELLKART